MQVFGADDPAHPSVSYLRNRVKDFYVGGKVQAIKAPTHFDYVALRCKLISKNTLGMTWINKSQIPQQSCALILKNFLGERLLPFRHETQCIEPTESSLCEQHANDKRCVNTLLILIDLALTRVLRTS